MTLPVQRGWRRVVLGMWIGLLAGASQAQPAEANPACAARSADAKGQAQVHNRCARPIAVYYCNAARPISKKRCGEQTVPGSVYYTHHRVVEPGHVSTFFHPLAEMRLAVCMGHANPAQPRGFLSQTDGSFTCPPIDKTALARANALGPSEAEACTAARQLLAPAGGAAVTCDCKAFKRASGESFHHCQAYGQLQGDQAKDGLIDNLKKWVREAKDCRPSDDAQQCRRRGHDFVGPTGSRG